MIPNPVTPDKQQPELAPLAWLLLSALGGALAALIVAGVLAGRLGIPIRGGLLLVAAVAGALPQLPAIARRRWSARVPELAAALTGLLLVGGIGLWLAWPTLLPLGLSVDAVHHYQLARWIAEQGAFPPYDGETVGLMGEMVAYPPGLALLVLGVATLVGRPLLEVLYPTVAAIGGLTAALVVLLAGSSGELKITNDEVSRPSSRRFLGSSFFIVHFLGLLVGPLLMLAHHVYTLEAYTSQSYYAMTLGVLLVLLAAGHLVVAPRLTPLGAAQFGLALAALVGVYPLWAAIPAAFAALSIAFGRQTRAADRTLAQVGMLPRDTAKPTRAPTVMSMLLPLRLFASAPLGANTRFGTRDSFQRPNDHVFVPAQRGMNMFMRHIQHEGRSKLLLGALALLPALALALVDLPERLHIGQIVLAHQGFVALPSLENLTPLLLALLCTPLLWLGHRRADGLPRQLLGLTAIALAVLLTLFGAAQAGYTASYHAYKLLFVLTPLATAIASAAALRLAALRHPLRRGLALAALGALLAWSGSLNIVPQSAVQVVSPDLVAATNWLAQNRPRDAKRAIAVGALPGPLDYWVQIGLLGQRRDKAELALRGLSIPLPSPESWVVDETLPKVVIAPALEQLPPGAEILARFGTAAVLRRTPDFEIQALDPLLVRYRTEWREQRLYMDIELAQRRAGRTPLLEVRLAGADGWATTFPLQPDTQRTRPQYLGLQFDPEMLGASGYVNQDAFPSFVPPADAPTGALTLTLRLRLGDATLDERTLASFHRSAAGQVERIAASSGELIYLRQPGDTPTEHSVSARVGGDLLLTGWSHPERARSGETLAISLRWQALRPIDRALFVEVHIVDAQGRVVAESIAPPQGGFYPTWRWRPDETVADQQSIVLPANLAPGTYRFEVSTRDFGAAPGGERIAAQLAELRIE
jgi:hypothetical protein